MRGTTRQLLPTGLHKHVVMAAAWHGQPWKAVKVFQWDHLALPTLSVIMGFCAMETRALASKLDARSQCPVWSTGTFPTVAQVPEPTLGGVCFHCHQVYCRTPTGFSQGSQPGTKCTNQTVVILIQQPPTQPSPYSNTTF